jgi:hypothetical protein
VIPISQAENAATAQGFSHPVAVESKDGPSCFF